MQAQSIVVIGAGTMGSGIAQVAAQAGIDVQLIDATDEALQRSRAILRKSLDGAIKREKLTEQQATEVEQRIGWGLDWDAVKCADWIIEAVFEDPQVKREALGRIGELARPDAIISSNTSTLPIAALAEMSGAPERFIGMHFFNPAPAMKLVEVIPGAATPPAITDAAVALCERMGKEPKVSPDIPGFFVNRVFGSVLSAAVDIWMQGATPETIDSAIELGLGHKMGPLATADLVGLDVCVALLDSLHEQTGHPRFEIAPEFAAMVEAGKLGRKSGEGFYSYGD